TRRLVERSKADEQYWKKLKPRRRERRKLRRGLSRKKLKNLDLLEFASARQPQDCIGIWIQSISQCSPGAGGHSQIPAGPGFSVFCARVPAVVFGARGGAASTFSSTAHRLCSSPPTVES